MKDVFKSYYSLNLISAFCLSLLFICFISSCETKPKEDKETDKETSKETDKEITEFKNFIEQNSSDCDTSNDPPPIYRLNTYHKGGVYKPVTAGSIGGGNIHVITHGFAPAYYQAVEKYSQPGAPLLAWSPNAKQADWEGNPTGVRYFVGTFNPLAESLLAADPGSTVLCFSWIDHSATSSVSTPGYSEECTIPMGHTLNRALNTAFAPNQQRAIQFLGHSHGTKVVTVSGILAKHQQQAIPLQLTLFDSPEKAPLNSADNKLYEILPSFEPNRVSRFVENYISYYGECYNSNKGLESIIDVVLTAYAHGCGNDSTEDCITCSHEYGVVWYTAQNYKPGNGLGYAWSPLFNPNAPGFLSKDYIENDNSGNISLSSTTQCETSTGIISCE